MRTIIKQFYIFRILSDHCPNISNYFSLRKTNLLLFVGLCLTLLSASNFRFSSFVPHYENIDRELYGSCGQYFSKFEGSRRERIVTAKDVEITRALFQAITCKCFNVFRTFSSNGILIEVTLSVVLESNIHSLLIIFQKNVSVLCNGTTVGCNTHLLLQTFRSLIKSNAFSENGTLSSIETTFC